MGGEARIAVALATKDRARELTDLLDSLEAQTVGRDAFEVVVVDDGSTDATRDLLTRRSDSAALQLSWLHNESSRGPAYARNRAWRACRAPLIVFTDDDCVATPEWLAEYLKAAADNPGAIVQGRTEPRPDQAHRLSPFSRTQTVHSAGPRFETCNIMYPRQLLERLDGFAEEVFPLVSGEDTDLAWRALGQSARAVYAPSALNHHAVVEVGAFGMLRHARRWEDAMPLYARHPGLRSQLHRGFFWSRRHEELLRFLLALALVRRSRIAAFLLARPYLAYLVLRRSGPLLAPYLLALDLVETYSVVRGAVRNRVFVI